MNNPTVSSIFLGLAAFEADLRTVSPDVSVCASAAGITIRGSELDCMRVYDHLIGPGAIAGTDVAFKSHWNDTWHMWRVEVTPTIKKSA